MKRLLLICLLVLWPALGMTQTSTMEVGVRGGIDATSMREDFSVAELYYQHVLPWQFEISSGVVITSRFDAGAGVLRADSEAGGWVALGIDAVLALGDGLWEIEAGFRPTWLSRQHFGDDDFGGPIQFSSHAGVSLVLGRAVLSYRFQHISNADLYDENDGIDLHLVGLGFRF